jgi:hypothetical protein
MGTKANSNPLNHDRYTDAEAANAAKAIVQDTPVNGVTDQPISSNWAYDHKADPSAHHTKTVSSEIDHGSVQGLADDDHKQYLHLSVERTMTTHFNFKTASGDMFYTMNSAGTGLWYYFYTSTLAFWVRRISDWADLLTLDSNGNLNVPGTVKGVTPIGTSYTARSDVAAYDFTKANFTIDGAWHTLDLSGIVPSGAKAVSLLVEFTATVAGRRVLFDRDGYVNHCTAVGVWVPVANYKLGPSLVVPVSTARKIMYNVVAASGEVTDLNLTVTGWWV